MNSLYLIKWTWVQIPPVPELKLVSMHLWPSGRRHRTHNPYLVRDNAGSNPAGCNLSNIITSLDAQDSNIKIFLKNLKYQ